MYVDREPEEPGGLPEDLDLSEAGEAPGVSSTGSLWRYADFVRLWAGQTVSLGGSLVGTFALPLVAVLTLEAGPSEVALLRLASMAPGVAVGLIVGAWVDRVRRRPLMIGADLGRALLLALIPLAAFVGLLRIEVLLLVGLAVGTLTVLFEVANRSYLPALVGQTRLVEANSKLQASSAVVEVASFGGAGWLVQAVTAPIAILVDALSFVVSAVALWRIRRPEPPVAPVDERQATWEEIRAGLRFVVAHPLLRPLMVSVGLSQLFLHVWVSMLTLFLVRGLDVEPGLLGMLYAIGGVTSLGGAVLASRAIERLGVGPALIGCLLLYNLSLLFVPFAGGSLLAIALFVGAQQLFDAAAVVYQVDEASLLQVAVPAHVLGRVVAFHGFVTAAAMLTGTALGGVLGETIGPRETMLVGGVGSLLAVVPLVLSPLRSLRVMPAA
ncbi:MAG: MFS transporter [Chloroflexi bacterium]|nr:MFS transporter [Chloroflexota bacterium]